ncbi:MAG TPA: GTPase Era [Marinilabiliales bacterium]|nr:MAG: GTPase Era [Bacteroidetes bacterium GWD2_40_43]OFX91958.1 MAG: GTPase Era [Bacteroidetes bacterium GWE2_40_63]OFY24625.1 MAG: GTPase Era [Bacteroidetes bacterium GWF2_40_13]OFZ26867.1 MAG: GTPase Era [Bacteroidetes bacterium RIFOXYC2_FULL_40_12]HAN00369.1 GTPase Era [Marinilabiliales bacterium]
MDHKAGFVNIIGNPNVGKSTLMNAFVGEKLSIITSKAQTTRHRILGIVNGDDFQLVYSDTPGILKPNYKLQQNMMKFVDTAITDADIILYVTDVVEMPEKNADYLEKIKDSGSPVLLLINKIDLTRQDILEKLVEDWKNKLPKAEIFPVSALEKFNIEPVFKRILELLPASPPYFPKDELTDKTERFFVQEIIREKIFLNYQKEIPYSCEVNAEEFKESDDIIHIRAMIYMARDSQKGIIIGHKGLALKKVGTEARKDMEAFFEKKVFLALHVKVLKDWRDKEQNLKYFGYEN